MRIRLLSFVACGLLLAGCTVPSAEPTEGPTTTPTPTPTDSIPTGPAPVLPLSCADLIPDSTFDEMLGFAPPELTPLSGYGLAANRQRGWELCAWFSSEPSASVSVSFDLRHDGATPTETECFSATPTHANCAKTGVVGGWLVRGQLVTATGPALGDPLAATEALLGPVFARLADEQAPVPWVSTDGVGPSILDCAAVSAPLDRAALGMPDGAVLVDVTGRGEDGSIPRQEAAVGGETKCVWVSEATVAGVARIELAFLAGGAWAWGELIPGPGMALEPATVDGADDATLECTTGGECSLLVRLGSDLARVTVQQGADWLSANREQVLVTGREILPALSAVVG
jgi:hypothetical protein